jgi:AraC family transcriptional regulator, regulatory protein of adaptative response / methylated-DNA-[protein]-cysteine methyltransferase
MTERFFQFESKALSAAAARRSDTLPPDYRRNTTMNTIDSNCLCETLRFDFGETRLGLALVAVSSRGVAAILLGDDKPRLRNELARAFPNTDLIEDEAGLAETLAEVVALIDHPRNGHDLTLDLAGSPIEVTVWQALREIPIGETRSYGQLAKALPIAATAQEVGAACAANLLAVAVPCHRVLKADGSISGYRWGVHRKRRLLAMEKAA